MTGHMTAGTHSSLGISKVTREDFPILTSPTIQQLTETIAIKNK